MANTDGLIPCSECGHIHYDFWKNEYAKCPLASEGCTCTGPAPILTDEQIAKKSQGFTAGWYDCISGQPYSVDPDSDSFMADGYEKGWNRAFSRTAFTDFVALHAEFLAGLYAIGGRS